MSVELQDDERYLLSFCFFGDDLPLQELSDKLNIEAKSIEIKGQHRNNNPKFVINTTNSWSSPPLKGYKPEDFYTEIEKILASFAKQEDYILDLINNKGVGIQLYATLKGGPCVTELLLPSFWKEFDKYQITLMLDSCP